jgi:hypothetical protein
MEKEVWKWNVNLAWELFSSGIYFYRKALNSKFEHQRHMYYKNGILSIVTSVEVYINQLLISEEKWSKSKVKDTYLVNKFEYFGVNDDLYKTSKNLRNIYIVHFKEKDHKYFDEINENTFLEAIESAQEIIAKINFNKNRLFPYWITGVNFINPSHNYDLDLSNNMEFWRHMKYSGYLNIEIFDIVENLIYNIDEYDSYRELYSELWHKIKKENFKLKFYKNEKFPKMPILSCEFWD